MQYKALVALLATTAFAAPAADANPENGNPVMSPQGEILIYSDVPSSILAILETAIPTPWVDSFYSNSAFRSSEINDVMHGAYPAWYSSLPQSVKDWANAAATGESPSSYPPIEMPTAPPCTGSSGVASTSRPSSTPYASASSASTSTSTFIMTTTTGGSSASASGSGSSPTSNAGAPAASGGIAMSLAGAAGILGLALVL